MTRPQPRRAVFGRAWWDKVGHISIQDADGTRTYVDPVGDPSPILCPICVEGFLDGDDTTDVATARDLTPFNAMG